MTGPAGPAPAGERLEPVEPGQPLTEGRYVMTTPVEVDASRQIVDRPLGEGSAKVLATVNAFPDATWQRVVVDPPLPDEAGRTAYVYLERDTEHGYRGAEVFSVRHPDVGHGVLWMTHLGEMYRPDQITRVLHVYPKWDPQP